MIAHCNRTLAPHPPHDFARFPDNGNWGDRKRVTYRCPGYATTEGARRCTICGRAVAGCDCERVKAEHYAEMNREWWGDEPREPTC